MKIVKPLPPEEMKLKLSAHTVEELKLYQTYQRQEAETKWAIPEMVAAILDVFLTEGDEQFLTWRKRYKHPLTAVKPNGASLDA